MVMGIRRTAHRDGRMASSKEVPQPHYWGRCWIYPILRRSVLRFPERQSSLATQLVTVGRENTPFSGVYLPNKSEHRATVPETKAWGDSHGTKCPQSRNKYGPM